VRSSLAICAALLAALCLAACGGGGSDSTGSTDAGTTDTTITDGEEARSPAEEEARAAAVAATDNDDAKTFCHEQVTAAFIKRVYGGSLKKCVGSEGTLPEHPGKATAGDTKLDPDEEGADVQISIAGGSLDGATGGVEMVKEGGAWKIDDYDDDFLRSSFLASIRSVKEGAISTPGMKACFTRQLQTLPAATVRELSYLSYSGDEASEFSGMKKIAQKCPQSALAEYGATALTAEIEAKGHKPGYRKCLYGEIKGALELTGITLQLFGEHPNQAAVAALEGIVEGAKSNCGG
jgi:hypothetical protein